MLFNSLIFLVFFPVVCIIYWVLPHKFRTIFLLIASYYFYMNWEPVFALLLLFSSFTTWICGKYIGKISEKKKKKIILVICLLSNLLILFIFKYADFVSQTINYFFEMTHVRMYIPPMGVLLPVGISFYTFQALGYTIDVYRGKIEPAKNIIVFFTFVSFFPQLVAGPIERAKNLLPQFHFKHKFNPEIFIEGIKLMLWGYFMKLCVADRVSPYVDAVYNNYLQHNGSSLLLGTFFFSFQIFCDFAGYSMIAIGVAKCMNFELMQNFNRPYLAKSIKTFWRRWHISLSTWFMDYLYIPMGGSRCSLPRHLFNLFITFLVSGIWHGANWTFILWGAFHGTFLIFGVLINKFFPKFTILPKVRGILGIVFTFILVMFTWVFFRANNITAAFEILNKIFTDPGNLYRGEGIPDLLLGLFCIFLLVFKEIKDELNLKIHFIHNKNNIVSTISMALMICFILLSAAFTGGAFIYFQF